MASKLIDLLTPGASVGVSAVSGSDNQVLQVLDMTTKALQELVRSCVAWCAWLCGAAITELAAVQKVRRESHNKSGSHTHVPMFMFTGFNEDNIAKHDKLLPILMAWASQVSSDGLAQVCCAAYLQYPRLASPIELV